jgi:uncharacterized Zn finger protein (UPF0148 family)
VGDQRAVERREFGEVVDQHVAPIAGEAGPTGRLDVGGHGRPTALLPGHGQYVAMKVRGERECQSCGARWSYYETGDVACPDCGSLRSVATEDDRKRHTDAPAALDLTRYQTAVAEDEPLDSFATDLQRDCRAYLRRRGFIHAGELRPLDDRFLAVHELLTAVADVERARRMGGGYSTGDDAVERYLVALLADIDDGERPSPDEVPAPLTPARGLAYATALGEYREEVATYLDDEPDPAGRRLLGRIRDHVKRVEALDGDVPPGEVEVLVRAFDDLYSYLTGDESALATARERLDGLD